MYKLHVKDTEDYFINRKADFLKFNIDIDGPDKICHFLKNTYPNLDKNLWKFVR